MSQTTMKKQAAAAAIEFVETGMVVGVGTGSTVNFFIEQLAQIKGKIDGAVASSVATEKLLKKHGIPVIDLNSVQNLPLYVDGADEFNPYLNLIKGGGAALTREKIVASAASQFICIADNSKQVDVLGKFPLAIEVIPMARSYVARQLVRLGGDPEFRLGTVTDNGNVILDVFNLDLVKPLAMEEKINQIAGVVCNGLFAQRAADLVLMATPHGIETLSNPLKHS